MSWCLCTPAHLPACLTACPPACLLRPFASAQTAESWLLCNFTTYQGDTLFPTMEVDTLFPTMEVEGPFQEDERLNYTTLHVHSWKLASEHIFSDQRLWPQARDLESTVSQEPALCPVLREPWVGHENSVGMYLHQPNLPTLKTFYSECPKKLHIPRPRAPSMSTKWATGATHLRGKTFSVGTFGVLKLLKSKRYMTACCPNPHSQRPRTKNAVQSHQQLPLWHNQNWQIPRPICPGWRPGNSNKPKLLERSAVGALGAGHMLLVHHLRLIQFLSWNPPGPLGQMVVSQNENYQEVDHRF